MIRGILFDKDGTLLQFDELWGSATQRVIPAFLNCMEVSCTKKRTDVLLERLGISNEGIDANKALAWMTYEQMGKVLNQCLIEEGIRIDAAMAGEVLRQLYLGEITQPSARILPTADLKTLLYWLEDEGIRIGMATADSRKATVHCLKKMGIDHCFEYIGTASNWTKPKPEKDLFVAFQKKFQLLPEEVAVVGDTPTDMEFAKKCGGLAVGVLSGTGTFEELSERAEYIFQDVGEIMEHWEDMNRNLRRSEVVWQN